MNDETPNATPNAAPAPRAPVEPQKSLWGRIPPRLFGGRVRTTTAGLVVLFLAALVLYGARSDHYAELEDQARQQQSSQVRQTPTPTPEVQTPEPVPEVTSTPQVSRTPESTETEVETTEPTGPQQETTTPQESTSQSTTRSGLLPRLELPTISIAP